METHPCQGLYDQFGKALEEWGLYSKHSTIPISNFNLDLTVDVIPIFISPEEWDLIKENEKKRDAAKARVMELQEKISDCQKANK
jgi:hypothetical protein